MISLRKMIGRLQVCEKSIKETEDGNKKEFFYSYCFYMFLSFRQFVFEKVVSFSSLVVPVQRKQRILHSTFPIFV